MLNFFKLFCFVVFCFFSTLIFADNNIPAPKASVETLDRIVADANGSIIMQSELDAAIARTKQQINSMHAQMPPDEQIRQGVLDQLINQKLLLQIAQRNNMKVTNEQIDNALKKIAAQNNITVPQLQQKITSEGYTLAQFRKELSNQILIDQVQQEGVAHTVSVTKQDVAAYLQQLHAQQQVNKQYHIADILIPVTTDNAQQWQNAQKMAEQIKQQLQQGQNVNTIVKQFSQAQYNDLGWQLANNLPNLFADEITHMKNNSIAGPLKAGNGYHVIQLLGQQAQQQQAAPMPPHADLEQLVFRQKYAEALHKWILKLRSTAYVKIY